MKKKALITSILSIVACLCLMTGATFALFTSTSTVNIAVSSGGVEVTAKVNVDSVKYKTLTVTSWTDATDGVTTFDGIGSKATVTEDKVKLENVVPGDSLKFEVVINNASTVAVKTRTVIENDVSKDTGLFELLEVKVDDRDFNDAVVSDWETINPGSADVIVPVEIVFPESATKQGTSCEIVVLVEAVQGNAEVNNSMVDDGNTITINDRYGLQAFAKSVNSGNTYSGKTVVLGDDIDLNNINWTPIGTASNMFKGTFDGNGKIVSNLYVNRPEDGGVGLFGYVTSATIKNLTVENADVTGYQEVAAIVAGGNYKTFTVSNCHVKGDINVKAKYAYAAGIASSGYATIDNCSVVADGVGYVTVEEKNAAGGIVGFTYEDASDITDCVVKNLEITAWANIGSIAGFIHRGCSITGCEVENVKITKTRVGGNGTLGYAAGGWDYTAGHPIVISDNDFTNVSLNGNYLANANNLKGMNAMFGGEFYAQASANIDAIFTMENNTLVDCEDNRYAKVETAEELTSVVNIATDGMVIGFINDIQGNATILQRRDIDLVVDGRGFKYDGTIVLHGGLQGGESPETLVIKNIDFVGLNDSIDANSTNVGERYVHNVTIDNCTFKGDYANGVEVVGIRLRQTFGVTVKNVTADDMHSLIWATGGDDLTIDNVTLTACKNGISLATVSTITMNKVNITAIGEYGYGVRVDANGAYTLNIKDSVIKASAPVLLRKATGAYTLNFEGVNALTVTGTTNPNGYQIIATPNDFEEGVDLTPSTTVTVNGGSGFSIN